VHDKAGGLGWYAGEHVSSQRRPRRALGIVHDQLVPESFACLGARHRDNVLNLRRPIVDLGRIDLDSYRVIQASATIAHQLIVQ
jgi:hypothetical protein